MFYMTSPFRVCEINFVGTCTKFKNSSNAFTFIGAKNPSQSKNRICNT